MKKIIALLVAFVLTGLPFSLTSSEATEVTESPEITIGRAIPDFKDLNFDNPNVEAIKVQNEIEIQTTDIANANLGSSQLLTVRIPDISNSTTLAPGLTSFTGDNSASGIVQETSSGFRVIRTINSPDDLDSQNYELAVGVDAHLEAVADGYLVLDGTDVRGAIGLPWAVDARGRNLETHYRLVGTTLTQTVRVDSETSYPIIADPNWSYTYTYTTRTSPNTNWIKLHNCFNCYFPISGAPSWWPAPNELLPLIVFLQNMECRMGTVVVGGLQDYSWSFRATANHLDGYGSHITFALRYVGGTPSLIVSAFVVNDPVNKDLMLMMANSQWQTFATNLGYK